MTDLLLDGAFAPFTMALALLLGLVGMEVLALLLGGSLLAGDSDADLDGPGGVELDADLDIGGVDLDALDGVDLDALDIDGLDGLEADAPATAPEISGGGGVLSWLGIGRMPFLIWLGSALMAFGLSGMALQLSLRDLFQIFAPAGLVSLPAGVFALWFARGFGAAFAARRRSMNGCRLRPRPPRPLRGCCRKPKPKPCPKAPSAAAVEPSPKAPRPAGALPRSVSWTVLATPITCAPNP